MSVTAGEALERLREGNRRFRQPAPCTGETPSERSRFTDLSGGQEPFAAVLGCSDSRAPVEMVFDQGPGDLFVVRVAGNVVGPTGIGSLEFAVKELGVPLLLVMGHTGCGAVAATLAPSPVGAQGRLTHSLGEITGRIWESLAAWGHSEPTGAEPLPEEVERLHAVEVAKDLVQQSELIASAVESGELQIVSSIYDLKTGQVEFFTETSLRHSEDTIPQ